MEATLDDVLDWATAMYCDHPEMGVGGVGAHWAGTFPRYRNEVIEHLAAMELMDTLARYALTVRDVDIEAWLADAHRAVERVESGEGDPLRRTA